METFYSIVSFVLMLVVLYLLLNYRMMKVFEQRFNDGYKNKLQNDIKEFYREMESYSALFENRIGRFKKLVERQEANLRRWEQVLEDIKKSRKGKQISDYIEKSLTREEELITAIGRVRSESAELLDNMDSRQKAAPQMPAAEPKPKTKPKAKAAATPRTTKQPTPSPKKATPVAASASSGAKQPSEDLSLSAAEELTMQGKDAYGAATKPKQNAMPTEEETARSVDENPEAGGPQMLVSLLSKVGRAVSPLIGKDDESPTNSPIERDLSAAPIPPAENFQQLLAEREKKQDDNAVPSMGEDTVTISKEIEQRLSQDELMQVAADLHTAGKRPLALKMLLKKGYSLSYISDLANIPYSELEATRQIYSL